MQKREEKGHLPVLAREEDLPLPATDDINITPQLFNEQEKVDENLFTKDEKANQRQLPHRAKFEYDKTTRVRWPVRQQ